MLSIRRNYQKQKSYRNSRGQSISEYGAMLAFVAILAALVFGITHGHLAGAVCAAFCEMSVQLNNMSNEATNPS